MRTIIIALGIGLSVFAAWVIFEMVAGGDAEDCIAEIVLCAGEHLQ